MNLRSAGTSTLSLYFSFFERPWKVPSRRPWKTSAMAVSLIGPLVVSRASPIAPPPRPPQPTRATLTTSEPAAWTAGTANADAAVATAAALVNERRETLGWSDMWEISCGVPDWGTGGRNGLLLTASYPRGRAGRQVQGFTRSSSQLLSRRQRRRRWGSK